MSENRSLNGSYEEYYNNGQLKIKKNYLNNYLHGSYEEYYDDGQLKIKTNYLNGRLNGLYEEWNYDGSKYSQKNFCYDIIHGECKKWYYNGHINTIENYKFGVKHGYFETHSQYLTNGYFINEKSFYKDGRLHGLYIKNTNNVIEKVEYINGKKKTFFNFYFITKKFKINQTICTKMEKVIYNNYKLNYFFYDLSHLKDIIKDYLNSNEYHFKQLKTKKNYIIWNDYNEIERQKYDCIIL